jgi:hypothetical protein
VSFQSDVQESLKFLDNKPNFSWKESHYKYISIKKAYNDCQAEPGLRQITQTSMLAVELGLRCIT